MRMHSHEMFVIIKGTFIFFKKTCLFETILCVQKGYKDDIMY